MSLNCSPLIRPSLHMRVPAYAHTRIRMRTCTLGVKKTCDNTLSCCCTDARAYGWDLPEAPQLKWSRFIENKVSWPCICFACMLMRSPSQLWRLVRECGSACCSFGCALSYSQTEQRDPAPQRHLHRHSDACWRGDPSGEVKVKRLHAHSGSCVRPRARHGLTHFGARSAHVK